jgi:hypothetical protein
MYVKIGRPKISIVVVPYALESHFAKISPASAVWSAYARQERPVNLRVVHRLFSPRLLSIVLTTLAFTAAAHATQVALVGDASVSTARPSTNFGALSNLYVGNGNIAFLQFDLTTLPIGLTSSQIAHATLTVFVNRVNGIGLVTLAPVTSAWTESSVTSATAPSLGASAGMFTASTAGQYVTLDVTSLVQGWVTAPATNFGFALSSGTANLLLDSKENDETGHPASLDITITSEGATGPQGIPGPQGAAGATGAAGAAGANGVPGPLGPQGIPGATGPAGTIGIVSNWSSSATYQIGQVVFCAACSTNGSSFVATAANTNQDPPTQTGFWNLIAEQGATGPAGLTGPVGSIGPQGIVGPQGPLGNPGATGAAGATGPIGPIGPQGVPGTTGATGPAGTIGIVSNWSSSVTYQIGQVVFCAACSTNGSSFVATAANTNQDPPTQTGFWNLIAEQGATGPAGPTGPIGPQGIVGPQGPLGNPGATGATGNAGPVGPTGAIGPVGPIGPQGIVGPQGNPGATGATGATGAVGATGAQGNPGVNGTDGTGSVTSVTIGTVTNTAAAGAGTLTITNPTSTPTIHINFPSAPGSGGNLAFGGTVASGTTLSTAQSSFYLVADQATFTLPPATTAGQQLIFTDNDPTNNGSQFTVLTRAGDHINDAGAVEGGLTSDQLIAFITMVSDGAGNWWVINAV